MGSRPAKGAKIAIAEWPTANGPADYALFVDTMFVGVVEAKRRRKNVSGRHRSGRALFRGTSPSRATSACVGGPWGTHKVPFVFAANGRSYLKQIETESGIWFRDARRAANLSAALVDWPTPEGLAGLLEVDQDAATAALKAQPFDVWLPASRLPERAPSRPWKGRLEAERRSMLHRDGDRHRQD